MMGSRVRKGVGHSHRLASHSLTPGLARLAKLQAAHLRIDYGYGLGSARDQLVVYYRL